jgi:hypothetical protein
VSKRHAESKPTGGKVTLRRNLIERGGTSEARYGTYWRGTAALIAARAFFVAPNTKRAEKPLVGLLKHPQI